MPGSTTDMVDAVIAALHRKLRAKPLRELLANLASLTSRPLTVGTVCSGTDMPMYQLRRLHDAWQILYELEVNFLHIFSCEIAPTAQSFILKHNSPHFLFRDIMELGHDVAYCVKTECMQPVPEVDIVVGGTECDNYSGLNFHTRAQQDGQEHGMSDITVGCKNWSLLIIKACMRRLKTR